MWTFPSYFYFKKGSLPERKFVAAQTGPVHRQPGVWYPKGIPDVKFNRERRTAQDLNIPRQSAAEAASAGGAANDNAQGGFGAAAPIVPNPRKTKADETGDITSLTRKLDRTLYLLISEDGKTWKFPTTGIVPKEPLHDAAIRGLETLGGVDMHTWTVSNTPCAVVRYQDDKRQSIINEQQFSIEEDNDSILEKLSALTKSREYMIKAHIIHGTFVPQTKGLQFSWLSKEEIKEKVTPEYWDQVEVLLSNQ